MNAIDSKINYFVSRWDQLKLLQEKMKTLIDDPDAKVIDVKKLELEIKACDGKLSEELREWFIAQGLPETNVHLIEIIRFFRQAKAIEVP